MFTSKSIKMLKQERLELYAQFVTNMQFKPTKFKMSNQLIAARALCAFDLMPPGSQELLLPVLNQLEFAVHFAIRNKPGMLGLNSYPAPLKAMALINVIGELADSEASAQFIDLQLLIKSSDWPIVQLLIHNCFDQVRLTELVDALILH